MEETFLMFLIKQEIYFLGRFKKKQNCTNWLDFLFTNNILGTNCLIWSKTTIM